MTESWLIDRGLIFVSMDHDWIDGDGEDREMLEKYDQITDRITNQARLAIRGSMIAEGITSIDRGDPINGCDARS